MKRYYIIVEGLVQGVGFRYFTQTIAIDYTCTGYVRNLDNGMVEIQVQSDEEKLNQFLHVLKAGTRFAKVENISLKEIPLCASEKSFMYL